MNPVDLILTGIVLFSLFRGYQRGLILTVASLVSYIAAWWAAVQYSGRAAQWLLETPAIYRPLYGWLRELLEKRSSADGFGHLVEETLQETWFAIPLPQVAHGWLPPPESTEALIQGTEEWLLNQAAAALTQVVVSFIAFVLVFLVVKYLVYAASLVVHGFFQLPLLSTLNRLGGIGAGLIRGILIVWVLLILVTPLVAADPQGLLATGLRESVLLEKLSWLPFG